MELTVNLGGIEFVATRPRLESDGSVVARLMLVDKNGNVAHLDATTYADIERLEDGVGKLRSELAAATSGVRQVYPRPA